MNLSPILSYLSDLERNNNREWYHAHKAQYRAAGQAFEELVRRLVLELRARDDTIPLLEPGELTFKLTRDTRFSHDKSPYNPAFRAHIAARGKLPIPVGYFLLIRPGGRSFLGGGLFGDMFRDATAMVRAHIAAHGGAWERILEAPDFAARFTVGGTAPDEALQRLSHRGAAGLPDAGAAVNAAAEAARRPPLLVFSPPAPPRPAAPAGGRPPCTW